jgi:hypothetical protein
LPRARLDGPLLESRDALGPCGGGIAPLDPVGPGARGPLPLAVTVRVVLSPLMSSAVTVIWFSPGMSRIAGIDQRISQT